MSVNSVIAYLSTITNLTTSLKEKLGSEMEVENYKSHQIIHSAGQVENRFWFIDTGFARNYYFDKTGKEHTIAFYNDKSMLFSYEGYWKQSTDYYIEILGPSELVSLTYERLSSFIKDYPEVQTLVRYIVRFQHQQDLFKSRLMSWSAEERYYQFRKNYPDIFSKASIRLIASYLNMTRENLSRLMGREK